jgi:hypothetical protein
MGNCLDLLSGCELVSQKSILEHGFQILRATQPTNMVNLKSIAMFDNEINLVVVLHMNIMCPYPNAYKCIFMLVSITSIHFCVLDQTWVIYVYNNAAQVCAAMGQRHATMGINLHGRPAL